MEKMNTLQCVRAVIWENKEKKRALVVQRSADDSHNPRYWEFPGGKVDSDTVLEALEREISEEVSIRYELDFQQMPMRVTGFTPENHPKYPGWIVTTIFYEVIALGDPKISSEHADWKYLTLEEMRDLLLTQNSQAIHYLLSEGTEDETNFVYV